MSTALLRVSHAGPLVSIQDGGRFGQMRYGVSASGPMDRTAFAIANAALGQPEGSSGIEISLGGLVLECRAGAVTFAICGGGFQVECGGKKTASWSIQTLHEGQKLSVRGGPRGSWSYLAFAGALKSKTWLGHSATHSMSGFGGGALRSGQTLEIEQASIREDRVGDIPCPEFAMPSDVARVVIGPQEQHFAPASTADFLAQSYKLTDAFDRMGVRLDGPELPLKNALSIPSEPILRGSVQVSGDGVPTVLLSDHQTTGGYPKIATLISGDVNRLAQMRSQDEIKFCAISPAEAVALTRKETQTLQAFFKQLAEPKLSLTDRLLSENIIGGIVTGYEP